MSREETGAPRGSGSPRPADEPRLPDLQALLRQVDDLRLTLSTDLSLAAAAAEAGEQRLAAELVEGDRDALAAFEIDALRTLRALEGLSTRPRTELPAAAPPVPALPAPDLPADAPAPDGAPAPVVPLRRRRPIVPAASLVAAAAALLGFVVGAVPQRGASTPPAPSMSNAAMASFSELNRLAAQGAPPDQVRRAAEELQRQLAALVERAGTDPAVAEQALALLQSGSAALAEQQDEDAVREVLAEVQALAARLRAVLPVATRPGAPALALPAGVVPTARPASSPRTAPALRRSSPRPTPAPLADPARRSEPSARSSSSASPTPSPARSAATAGASAGSTSGTGQEGSTAPSPEATEPSSRPQPGSSPGATPAPATSTTSGSGTSSGSGSGEGEQPDERSPLPRVEGLPRR